MTVFVYINTSKQVGDVDHIKVFATTDAAETWFEENDPEGVAFECGSRVNRIGPRRHPSTLNGIPDHRVVLPYGQHHTGPA